MSRFKVYKVLSMLISQLLNVLGRVNRIVIAVTTVQLKKNEGGGRNGHDKGPMRRLWRRDEHLLGHGSYEPHERGQAQVLNAVQIL